MEARGSVLISIFPCSEICTKLTWKRQRQRTRKQASSADLSRNPVFAVSRRHTCLPCPPLRKLARAGGVETQGKIRGCNSRKYFSLGSPPRPLMSFCCFRRTKRKTASLLWIDEDNTGDSAEQTQRRRANLMAWGGGRVQDGI